VQALWLCAPPPELVLGGARLAQLIKTGAVPPLERLLDVPTV
jgi:hypothetical protein